MAKAAIFIGMGSFAFFGFLELALTRGAIDAREIEFSTPWTGLQREKWSDLQTISYDDWMSWHTLSFQSGSKIRLSVYRHGHASALDHAKTVERKATKRVRRKE